MATNDHNSSHSRQIDAAIAEYLEALEQGTPLDREAFLAQHAEIADELRQFLEDDSALKRDAPRPIAGRAATSDQSNDSASPIAAALERAGTNERLSIRRGSRHHNRNPVSAARGDRRRGHGHGLDGRATRADAANGRPQADQARHGFQGRADPV